VVVHAADTLSFLILDLILTMSQFSNQRADIGQISQSYHTQKQAGIIYLLKP